MIVSELIKQLSALENQQQEICFERNHCFIVPVRSISERSSDGNDAYVLTDRSAVSEKDEKSNQKSTSEDISERLNENAKSIKDVWKTARESLNEYNKVYKDFLNTVLCTAGFLVDGKEQCVYSKTADRKGYLRIDTPDYQSNIPSYYFAYSTPYVLNFYAISKETGKVHPNPFSMLYNTLHKISNISNPDMLQSLLDEFTLTAPDNI